MRQYLCEGLLGSVPFIVERSKPIIKESRNGIVSTRIPGRFSVCDSINGNGRRYSRKVWEKNMAEGSHLQASIRGNKALGLLEHPADGIVTLLSPISHHVTSAKLIESKDAAGNSIWEVVGEIELYETEDGKKLAALIEGGYNPLVSSRGFGSLAKGPDGVDEVCEDYVCEGWDVVAKPSFESAELTPKRGVPQDRVPAGLGAADLVTTESIKGAGPTFSPAIKTESPVKESAEPKASSEARVHKPSQTMQLSEVKSAASALRGQLRGEITPRLFAESVQKIEELHRHAAEAGAADPKLAYETQRLHADLDRLTEAISKAISAPTETVKALREQNNKLMQVIATVAKTAVGYKAKLGEALKQANEKSKLVEELVRRGKGWQRVAESRKEKYTKLDGHFTVACEALTKVSARYHTDTTELGRAALMNEFREKIAADPKIQKQLKEATRLRHLATVRNILEGKTGKPADGEALNEGGKAKGVGKPADGAAPAMAIKKGDKKEKGDLVAKQPKQEGEEPKQGEEQKPAVVEGKKAPGTILLRDTADPRGLNESVAMVKRLSTSKA